MPKIYKTRSFFTTPKMEFLIAAMVLKHIFPIGRALYEFVIAFKNGFTKSFPRVY